MRPCQVCELQFLQQPHEDQRWLEIVRERARLLFSSQRDSSPIIHVRYYLNSYNKNFIHL